MVMVGRMVAARVSTSRLPQKNLQGKIDSTTMFITFSPKLSRLALRTRWAPQATPSSCDAQHYLAALMRLTPEHLVRTAGFFQREHCTDVRN